MFKLNENLTVYTKLAAAILLGLVLVGCGSGGGADNVICGGEVCTTSTDDEDDSTDEIDNIVDQGVPDSIEFVSVSPTVISIQGTGGDETAVVTFMVTDTAGDPIEGESVSFTINNEVGGISLSNLSDETNSDGEASAILNGGSVNSSVRVTASVESNPLITTVSDPIPISTGITDSDGFSLSFDILNPEGLDFNNTAVEVTVNLNDFYGNPPVDGTNVSFYAEAGTVESSCATTSGVCSVTWLSSNPRPGQGASAVGADDGIAQILAYTVGAESFNDMNADGYYDSGELWEDLGEVYADEDESGSYILGIGEFFVDSFPNGDDTDDDGTLNPNEMRDDSNGFYDGPLCRANCGESTIVIGASGSLVMSGSEAILDGATTLPTEGTSIVLGAGTSYFVLISDVNGNPMPSGTSISVEADNGDLGGTTSKTVPNSQQLASSGFVFSLAADDDPDSGLLTITVTTPLGVETSFTWTLTD
jgi:hypothetical protein